jgi:predicted membrane chloride channel (bestrophin family)
MQVLMKRVMDVLTGCESITKTPKGAAFHYNI